MQLEITFHENLATPVVCLAYGLDEVIYSIGSDKKLVLEDPIY